MDSLHYSWTPGQDPPSPSPPAVASADPTLEPGHVAVPAEVEAVVCLISTASTR